MNSNEPVTLTRDVEGSIVPAGTKVTLLKGEQAYVTQSLGGSYTVVVNGNMFRIAGQDADALGFEVLIELVGIKQGRRVPETVTEEQPQELGVRDGVPLHQVLVEHQIHIFLEDASAQGLLRQDHFRKPAGLQVIVQRGHHPAL